MARRKDKRPIWTGDAETDPFKDWTTPEEQRVPRPFIWGIYTGETQHFFSTVQEVVDFIKDEDVILYFHNGGKFDFHLESNATRLLDHINHYEDLKIINGRLVAAKIGRCEIRDSWNLFPAPLRDFGSKLDIDISKLEEDVRDQHMPEIKAYLAQDCQGLWNALDKFERTYGRHLTQAGASAAQWVELSGEPMPASDEKFYSRFFKYYFGGRVQPFRKGRIEGPVHVWDIRSAYPKAMLYEHPYEINYIEIDNPPHIEGPDMVTVECVSAGMLPWRNERGVIVYPNDGMLRIFHVPGWEVLAGVETGHLTHLRLLHTVRFFGLREFGCYIHHFDDMRSIHKANGDDANSFFAKRFMTGLYGKFAANPDNYGNFQCVPWNEKTEFEPEGYLFNGKIGIHAVIRKDLDPWQKHFINVATAASITSWVRAYLWRAISLSTDPIYCDTDSLFARDAPGLDIGNQLGQWQYEGTAETAWIAGKKTYYLQGAFEKGKTEKMAAKGVRPDPAKIRAAAEGQVVTFRSAAPTFSIAGKRPVYFQERKVRMT